MSIWGYDCRHFVVQVYQTGVRLLDGAKMTQELLFTSPKLDGVPDLPSNLAVEATIADPFVLLKMADGSLQLIIGGMIVISLTASSKLIKLCFKFCPRFSMNYQHLVMVLQVLLHSFCLLSFIVYGYGHTWNLRGALTMTLFIMFCNRS